MRKTIILLILLLIGLSSHAVDDSIVDSKWSRLFVPFNITQMSLPSDFPKLLKGELIYFKINNRNKKDKINCFYNKWSPNIEYATGHEIINALFYVDSITCNPVIWDRRSYRPSWYYWKIYLTNHSNGKNIIWNFHYKNEINLTIFSETLGEKMISPHSRIFIRKGFSDTNKADDYEPYEVESVLYSCDLIANRVCGGRLKITLISTNGDQFEYIYPSSESLEMPKAISEGAYLQLKEQDKQ